MPAFTMHLSRSICEQGRCCLTAGQRLMAGLPQPLLLAVMLALPLSAPVATQAAQAAQAAQAGPVAASTVQTPDPAATRISADDARRDLRTLKRAFTELHPGL